MRAASMFGPGAHLMAALALLKHFLARFRVACFGLAGQCHHTGKGDWHQMSKRAHPNHSAKLARYAVMASRSSGFFRPAKAILVPFM